MANKDQYKAADFLAAIPGSMGLISVIARRVGCDWRTARKYIEEKTTVSAAYEDEKNKILDLAESVVFGNVQAAHKIQDATKYGAQVDSSDAKWLLRMKGKDRGYVDRAEIDHAGDIAVTFKVINQPHAPDETARGVNSNGHNAGDRRYLDSPGDGR